MKSAEAFVLRASPSLPGEAPADVAVAQPVEQRPNAVVVVGDEPVQRNRRHAHDCFAHHPVLSSSPISAGLRPFDVTLLPPSLRPLWSRYPDLIESLVAAGRDPIPSRANLAELQAIISPLGFRPSVRLTQMTSVG
jgi:hypothetical protein